jgi:hypothetical protein
MENMNDPAKYFAFALLTAATLATPALTRESHVDRRAMDFYASVTPDTGSYTERACVRAPDVGAFASDPWTAPPCEPSTGL